MKDENVRVPKVVTVTERGNNGKHCEQLTEGIV